MVIKLLIKVQRPQKLNSRIIQKQLQMTIRKKNLKKHIYISAEENQKIIDDLRLI